MAEEYQNLTILNLNWSAYYEMDLTDFPWARFGRPQRAQQTATHLGPYTFTDVINGPDGPLERFWEVYPHLKYGFPSESTQRLFLVLLDLWAADDFRPSRIIFRSLTHLYRRLGGQGNCPQDRALRIHRDLQILEHLTIHIKNAFWDPTVRRYIDIDNFKLFGSAVYVSPKPARRGMPRPVQATVGYLAVTPELQSLAQAKVFSTSVPLSTALALSGQEAKLAFHLAKRFRFYEVYKRRVDDLCKIIPIEAARADNRRKRLRAVCRGLQRAGFAPLRSWRLTKERNTWLVEFIRSTPSAPAPRAAETRELEAVILEAGGDKKSLPYWRMCIRALGSVLMYRAVSEAKVYCRETPGADFPRVLTSRCEALAREFGAVINPRRSPQKSRNASRRGDA